MDPRVTELQCSMPIGNIPSVLARGILSHENAAKLPHHRVAMQAIQDKRDLKSVPGGLKVHQYGTPSTELKMDFPAAPAQLSLEGKGAGTRR